VPGRKNLIWFAGDFPVVIFPKFDQRMEAEQNTIPTSQIQKTADLLTSARVAVYPVFANGMMTEDILTSVNRSPSSAVNPTRMAAMSNMDAYIDSSSDRGALIAGMNQIASDTGGKAIYNTNDLNAATLRAVSDGSQYYTLAYAPTNPKLDGHYRKVEVKVPDSHYRLSYRRGYNADDALTTGAATETDPLRPLRRARGSSRASTRTQRHTRRQESQTDRPLHALQCGLHDSIVGRSSRRGTRRFTLRKNPGRLAGLRSRWQACELGGRNPGHEPKAGCVRGNP